MSEPSRRIASYYPDMVTATFTIHDAIVYKELEFWSQHATKEHDGHKWFYKSHKDISERTGLSERQVEVITRKLAENGTITRIHNPERGYDRTYWYQAIPHSTVEWNGIHQDVECNPPHGGMEPTEPGNGTHPQVECNPPPGGSNTSRDTLETDSRDAAETNTTDAVTAPRGRIQRLGKSKSHVATADKKRRRPAPAPSPDDAPVRETVEPPILDWEREQGYVRPDGKRMTVAEKLKVNQQRQQAA